MDDAFAPLDPIHGPLALPALIKTVVDTRLFQRLRRIKQLGVCSWVYPGAEHTRFGHSLGTAHLAHELVLSLRARQPELGVTDADVLCVALAGLCHDLGHPCFSHTFEAFVREAGRRRLAAGDEEGARRCELWSHEDASVALLRSLFEELRMPLAAAGLRAEDLVCIQELVRPPKRQLEEALGTGELRHAWPSLVRGRPVTKAWMYEIVANWRSGVDVDKFDYFQRDARYLGIPTAFSHARYMREVRVLDDDAGVPTLSPPAKLRDSLREMLELRKALHAKAYQHKTVVKLELHMVEILLHLEETLCVSDGQGGALSLSEAALTLEPAAYDMLTDSFVEAALGDPRFGAAAAEYERRFLRRRLMRCVGECAVPLERGGQVEAAVTGLLAEYARLAPARAVPAEELRCHVASIHCGMGRLDPLTRVVFHGRAGACSERAQPLRQKLRVFWDPEEPDEETLSRLAEAFAAWARG